MNVACCIVIIRGQRCRINDRRVVIARVICHDQDTVIDCDFIQRRARNLGHNAARVPPLQSTGHLVNAGLFRVEAFNDLKRRGLAERERSGQLVTVVRYDILSASSQFRWYKFRVVHVLPVL
jgi:hypothetical protein